jgi:hypothetical protein
MAYTWKINKTDGNVQIVSTPDAYSVKSANFNGTTVENGNAAAADVDIIKYVAADADGVWAKSIEAAYELLSVFPNLVPQEYGYPTGLASKDAYLLADITANWAKFLESQNDEGVIPAYSETLAYMEGLLTAQTTTPDTPSGAQALIDFSTVIEGFAQAGDEAGAAKYLKDNNLVFTKKHIYLFSEPQDG